MVNVPTDSSDHTRQPRVRAIHLRLQVNGQHGNTNDDAPITQRGLVGDVPTHGAIRAHDQFQLSPQRLPGGDYFGILGGIGIGHRGRKELVHSMADDSIGRKANSLAKSLIHEHVSTIEPLS